MGILPGFFSKKEHAKTPVASMSEELLKQKIQKVKSKRKQKDAHPKSSALSSPPVSSVTSASVKESIKPLPYETTTFYGRTVRKIYTQKRCFFVLEDVVSVSGVVEPNKYLLKLKRSQLYKEHADTFVTSFTIKIDGESTPVECIDAKGFAWLLPILRVDDVVFPGPFPQWIEDSNNGV